MGREATVVPACPANARGGNNLAVLVAMAGAQFGRGDARGCLATLRFLEERVPPQRLGLAGDVLDPMRRQVESQAGAAAVPGG